MPGLGARHKDDADGNTLPQHWYPKATSVADRTGQRSMLELRIELDIGYVDNRALEDRPARPEGSGWARRPDATRLRCGFGGVVVLGDLVEQLAVELKERAEESVAQSHGASDDRVEHRLHVGRRPADHAQDLARRRQVAVALSQFGEQAPVLNGNNSLVGEGLEERNLVASEAARLAASDAKRSDGVVVADQRHHHQASVTSETSARVLRVGQSRIAVSVGAVERRSIAHSLGVVILGVDRHGEARPLGGVTWVVGTCHRGEGDLIALDPAERAYVSAQQPDGALHDRVEDRLDVGLRLANNAQDFARRGLLVQSRGELTIAGLQFLEQAHVLDGDDGLVSEGLEKPNLDLSKWPGSSVRPPPPDRDRSDRLLAAHHRHGDEAPVADSSRHFLTR